MFLNPFIAFALFWGTAVHADDVPSSHSPLFRSRPGVVSNFKIQHMSHRVQVRGVSIHSWKKVFIHDYNAKLKHQPDEHQINDQEVRLDLLMRRLIENYTSDDEDHVVSKEIDVSDLSEVRISAFKPVKSDRFEFEGDLEQFKDLIHCAEGYCFFPVIFVRHSGLDLQWNPHYVKIGGKNRLAQSIFECEDFKSPFSVSFSYKTPQIDYFYHRKFLFLARFDHDQLKITEGRISTYESPSKKQ